MESVIGHKHKEGQHTLQFLVQISNKGYVTIQSNIHWAFS